MKKLFVFLLIFVLLFILPLDKLILFISKPLHFSLHPSKIFYFKTYMLKINIFIILFFLFFRKNYIFNYVACIKKEIKIGLPWVSLLLICIFLFHSILIMRDLLDLEKIIFEVIKGEKISPSNIILPNGARPADFYPPEDFTLFIKKVEKEIGFTANILYLGVERDIANYFLYPRKLYKPLEYEWLYLPKEELIRKQWIKDKNLNFIIRKYRPFGFMIEKIEE